MIDMDGSMVGVVTTAQAQRMADERNLDLVLFSPQAVPPVCKILDYGKYRYDQIKKDKQAQKNSKGTEIKEIQLSQTIDIGDLKTKAKHTRAFIEDKNKVKVTIRMRGRQNAHPELSVEMMAKFFEMVSDVAVKEKEPVLEGRNVTMMLGPIPTKK
ncbi:MAG: translation initiation factor IF-3 [Clostridia bacterium]|nr:translation initiation factor IF-3 [Clostridia bacterium]MBO7178236.1 translation initiation factor IF-3 [Clostridia bacterium]